MHIAPAKAWLNDFRVAGGRAKGPKNSGCDTGVGHLSGNMNLKLPELARVRLRPGPGLGKNQNLGPVAQ